ncbi:uncharacterized protein LOC134234566 [Saccostrea cucullata]|uniref:uncharacterized protein LOC134234566 n=1 Tax=Saccostrea cuccullata TaxID=36930 RepID=UPI002ED52FBC
MADSQSEANEPLLGRTRAGSTLPNLQDVKNWKAIGSSGLQGGKVYITLAIVILAIVFSMMTVNWTKMIYNEEESKSMLFGVLLCSITIGIISISFVLLSVLRGESHGNRSRQADSFSEKVKNKAGVGFGLLNFVHCAFFINKHAHGNDECTDKGLGIAYNVMSIIYTVLLIWGLFAFRLSKSTTIHHFSSIGILFANFSFWLDTIFSESGDIFHYENNQETTNVTSPTPLCNYSETATSLIKDIDPLLAPCSVEFAIISIDLLFSTHEETELDSVNTTSHDAQRNIETGGLIDDNQRRKEFTEKAPILFFVILSSSLVIIAIVSYIVTVKDDSKGHDFFEIYMCLSALLKFAMFCCITACLIMSWSSFDFEFTLEGLILMLSCFMNVVYHMFYLFAIWKGSKMEKDDTLVTFLGISYFENILSIFLAGEQTVFILAIENSKKMNENKYKSKIYFLCVLLSLSNFGIWGGDSFGEAKLPALSFIVEKYYSQTFWIICTKLILPFTIFFRIHSALMFLKMYGKRKTNNQTNPSLNTIPKIASSD